MKIFERITKGAEDYLLYENGILNSEGRLSEEGRKDVLDLLFLCKDIKEIRGLLIAEIKEINKQSKCSNQ